MVDLGAAPSLRSLRLWGNPLEVLPELGACRSLRHLSLVNARIDADDDLDTWTVEVRARPHGAMTLERHARQWLQGLARQSQHRPELSFTASFASCTVQPNITSHVVPPTPLQSWKNCDGLCRLPQQGATSLVCTSWHPCAPSSSSAAQHSTR